MRGRGIAAFVVIALAAVAFAAAATAGNVVRIDSKIRLSDQFPAFHGKVISDNHACEVQRTVKMKRVRSGPDQVLGTDQTNGQGRWFVEVDPLSSGAYYARVKRRAEGAAGTTFVCRPDRSRTLVVD
jgi:hypothetical protein